MFGCLSCNAAGPAGGAPAPQGVGVPCWAGLPDLVAGCLAAQAALSGLGGPALLRGGKRVNNRLVTRPVTVALKGRLVAGVAWGAWSSRRCIGGNTLKLRGHPKADRYRLPPEKAAWHRG